MIVMNRLQRRKDKWRKIRQRIKLIKDLWENANQNFRFDAFGKYSNDINYKRSTDCKKCSLRDKRQVENMKEQFEDYMRGTYEI